MVYYKSWLRGKVHGIHYTVYTIQYTQYTVQYTLYISYNMVIILLVPNNE